MTHDELSRRSLLHAIAASLGAVVLPIEWKDLERDTSQGKGSRLSVLSATDAADLDAVTALIIPTDEGPGAREAGVVYFIDAAMVSFLSQLAAEYRAQLAGFQDAFRTSHPGARTFASLLPDQQISYLKTVDRTPFFETTRLLTILGMFSKPSYGGNRNAVGWTLLGFEDRHYFRPPFGAYDRDYPGFVPDVVVNR